MHAVFQAIGHAYAGCGGMETEISVWLYRPLWAPRCSMCIEAQCSGPGVRAHFSIYCQVNTIPKCDEWILGAAEGLVQFEVLNSGDRDGLG
jgi:hypothetical protein